MTPTLIDLWLHAVPLIGVHVEFDSGETMGLEQGDRSHCWYLKNRLSEEFWLKHGYVWRGRDTSPNDTEFYDTFVSEQRATYGHPWLPRYIESGKEYTEHAYTVFRLKSNGTERAAYMAAYRIRAQYHETLTLPNGLEFDSVVELQDHDSPGVHYESKFYAMHYGLVMWRNERTGQTNQAVATRNGKTPFTRLKPVPDEPVNADTVRPFPKDLETPVTVTPTVATLNVRSAPTLHAPLILQLTEALDIWTDEARITEADGYTWRPLTFDNIAVLWCADEYITTEPRDDGIDYPDGCLPTLQRLIKGLT